MNVEIAPSRAKGVVNAPCSKSYAHRLLIGAALADGESVIKNISFNEDITATVSCLNALGAHVEVDGSQVYVKGVDLSSRQNECSLFCNESGSTLRFLIPLSIICSKKTIFSGAGRLMERPQSVYIDLFSEKGCYLNKENNILISGGDLTSGIYKVPGDVSSQFITGLLFALPLLDGDSEIEITGTLQSEPYVNITIEVLDAYGIKIQKKTDGYFIKGNQKYKAGEYTCQGDWSNAAFLHAFNLCSGDVQVTGLDYNSNQGDKVYVDYFKKLSESYCELDISQCPDLGPVLISCAALTNGALLTGTKRLKIKESDRGEAMRRELLKFGVNIEVLEDSINIPPVALTAPVEPLECHNDHRIAMSLAVLCSVTGGTLINAQCVNKSYPDFFDVIENLGIHINRRCQK